jgi:HTH-type transcriptional regulator/antitoxin HigA
MEIKLIKTEKDYNEALARVDELFDAVPGDANYDEAELLMTLVDLYEQKHFPIETPDPIEAIKFRRDQMGLKDADLAKFFGSRGRVSEVMNKKRSLNAKMMRILYSEFGVPAESLLA